VSGAALVPLRCDACGGSPPLREVAEVACPFCEAMVVVPPDYLEAACLRTLELAARAEAEPAWRAVAEGVSDWLPYAALGSVALAPPLAALLVNLLFEWRSQGEVMAYVALPLLLPGAALFFWSSAVNETTLGVRSALCAAPPHEEGKPPGCRSCGAPLAVGDEALFASCLYCETDSLLEAMPLRPLGESLRSTLKTLSDATSALRMRRRLLAFGVSGFTLFVAALSTLVAFGVHATLG
jgi:predicted RNA-binding Zn-ribbon protein involved in translation (DUF1610 family)